MDMITPSQVDEQRLQEFAGKAAADAASAFAVLLAYMGDQTGIYRAMRDIGPARVGEIAHAAGVDERYLLEWLSAQAAAGYVTYHGDDETFSLSPEQAIVLSEEGHPACLQGFFQCVIAQMDTHDKPSKPCAAAPAGPGASTTLARSAAPTGSSAPDTSPTWWTPGCRRSTASSTSWRKGRKWPTSAAAMARPPS